MEQTSLAKEISTHESWHKENANILASSSSTVDVTQFSWKPTWSILFVLGLSCDLPWSFFSTAMEDFKMRLGPDDHGNFTTTTVNQTKLQEYFNPSLTFINFSSLLIFSGIVSALHQRISERIRIIGSLFAISLLLALVTALIFIPALDKMPHIFFGITMLANFQIAAFVAVLRSSLTSIVGVFPQEYTVPLLSGQGMAGIFAALSKIITLLMYNLDPRMNSLYFFMIAIMFELIAIVCYIILRRLSLYKYYFAKVTHKKESQFVQEKCGTVFKDTPMDEKMEQNDGEQPDSILIVLKQIWPMALNICVNDVANISLFPAVCADVRTSLAPANSLWDKLFAPVGCFLMKMSGSFAGRMFTALIRFPEKNSSLLPLLVSAQILFIPMIIFCNVSPRSHTSSFFEHDAWFIFFNTLHGFCNGYFTTLLTSYGPKMATPKNAKTAGSLMVFFLSFGCIIGAAMSFLIRWII